MKEFRSACLAGVLAAFGLARPAIAAERPSVVLVITDDQGYGDLAAHGNPMIKTPNLDKMYEQSVRLADFHVDPTCAPTRAALITGRYSARVGVWHTIMGRSILRGDEVTMADVFKKAGYRTGMFGKWHLGDNYPYRPRDRGFDEVLCHGGGGVGQAPDYWGNDYFDDTYFHNGKPEKQSGYCTDVWFDAAIEFIRSSQDRPFFCYLATNAPHGPYLVDPKYSEPYKARGVPSPMAEFYGMISNIDENISRLTRTLADLNRIDNTIFIFMTDNGTAAGVAGGKSKPGGWRGFNAAMRGQKGSQYDGGHRVPCFVHWPAGGMAAGRDVSQLTAHVDLLPTLIELCGLETAAGVSFDGTSIARLLKGEPAAWPDRTLFVAVNRLDHPEPWRRTAVMTERWRLVDGKELYDITADPGQMADISTRQPEVVARLRNQYEGHWKDISSRFDQYVRLVVGAEEENPATISSHDWHAENVPWNHRQIEQMPEWNGVWQIEAAAAGRYRFALMHRPPEAKVPLRAVSARLKVGGFDEVKPVAQGATEAVFEVDLPAGPASMQTWLVEAGGAERGAFYVRVERLPARRK